MDRQLFNEALDHQLELQFAGIDPSTIKVAPNVLADDVFITLTPTDREADVSSRGAPSLSRLNVLPGSQIWGEEAKDDIDFSALASYPPTPVEREQMCAFVNQVLSDLHLEAAVSAADYNNLAYAYIWCYTTGDSLSGEAKAKVLSYLQLALAQADDAATKAKIQANINVFDPPPPPLSIRVPDSFKSKVLEMLQEDMDLNTFKSNLS